MLAVCLLAVSGGALAGEPSLADKETARSLFRRGDERFRSRDFNAALDAFVAADEIMGVPTTGLERGRSLVELGRLLEAAEVFDRVARTPKKHGEKPAQQTARSEAKGLLESTRRSIPSILVQVQGVSEQAGVRMEIDGVEIPESAQQFPRKVDPGKHLIRVTAQGYRAAEQIVDVAKGSHEEVSITLQGYTGSGVDQEDASDDGDGAIMPLVSWIGFGAAAVGLGIGVGFGAATLGNVSSLQDECGSESCPVDKAEDIDDATVIAHVSTVGFVVAGVGVAVGVVWLFLDGMEDDDSEDLEDEEVAVSLTPLLGPGFVGLQGTF